MPGLIAAQAQDAWGCTGQPVLLSHRENAVFSVRLPNGARAALRVHRVDYKSASEIEAELAFCAGLAEAGIICPRGIKNRDGAWVWRGQDRVLASLVSWVDGNAIGSGDRPLPPEAPLIYRDLGASLARMHRAADAIQARPQLIRPAWDLDGLTGANPIWGRYWENPDLDRIETQTILAARDLARARLIELEHAMSLGMIHADPLRENVFGTTHGLALIDFDDCGHGYRAYDLAVALAQSLDDPELPELYDAIISGYREAGTLTDADRAALPVLSMLRSFCALAWVVPRYPSGHPKGMLYKMRALRSAEAILSGVDFLSIRQ